jgi:hypothetical protein
MAGQPLVVLGEGGAVLRGKTAGWNYPTGESVQEHYRGVYNAVQALYTTYKAVAGYSPAIDSLQLTYEKGMGELTVSFVQDGPVLWELCSNMQTIQIELHPMFAAGGAKVLTDAQVHAVQVAISLGINQNPAQRDKDGALLAAPFDGSAFTANQSTLYAFLSRGVDSYYRTAYVLRSTQTCSKRSTLAASYTGVNAVVATGFAAAANTLIGEIPAGEWLKQAPQVRQVTNRKWNIVQEYWWAPQWSALLYGGTGTP